MRRTRGLGTMAGLLRLRVTYGRTADFLSDLEQQFSRRGLLVRVDVGAPERGADVKLDIVTPAGRVILDARVLQPMGAAGVAVELDPAGLDTLVGWAKRSAPVEGPPPRHERIDDPVADAAAAPPRLPRASTAPITPAADPPVRARASTAPVVAHDGSEDAPPRPARATTPAPVQQKRTGDEPRVTRTTARHGRGDDEGVPRTPRTTPVVPLPVQPDRADDDAPPRAARTATMPVAPPAVRPERAEVDMVPRHARPSTRPADPPASRGSTTPVAPIPAARGEIADVETAIASSLLSSEEDTTGELADGSDPASPLPFDEESDTSELARAKTLEAATHAQEQAKKIQIALHGDKNQRMAILRDGNRALHGYVLKNPQLQLDEIVFIARMPTVTADLLGQIANRREWAERPEVASALVRNPKTPIPLAIKMLDHLSETELRNVAKQGVRDQIQRAARKKLLG